MNQAVSLLYRRLSERYVQAVLKKKILVVGDEGSAVLPNDFVRIHQVGMGDDGEAIPTSTLPAVEGTYRIIGDTIYAYPSAYSLEYYYVPKHVSGLGEELVINVAVHRAGKPCAVRK